MPHSNGSWTVLPHGTLTQLADNLHTVTGQLRMPLGETTRRMTVVTLTGGRLAIYSAIALNESEMAKLEALGQPTFLIVPNELHRIDATAYKQRYPQLKVLAPEGSRDKVERVVQVDATATELGDPRVKLIVVPGTRDKEFAMTVESNGRTTLIVNDIIFNLPKIPGIAGLGLKLLGFGPGTPTIPKLVARKLVDDRGAVRSQLQAWANLTGLERVIVSHGAPIENPRDTLQRLASTL